MPHFNPGPGEAEQLTGWESVEDVARLVRRYQPTLSYDYSPADGTLRFYGDGVEHFLKPGFWAIVNANKIIVVPPSMIKSSAELPST